jgi:hypothetical protein
MTQLNTYSDVSALAQVIQDDAILTERNLNFMSQLVTVYRDASGLTPRSNYQYNAATAKSIGEADDLTSDAFTPAVLSTLTPSEIGLQFFLTDSRRETDTVENFVVDANRELGLAATDKVEADLLSLFPSLTGGTVGAAGTTMTWNYLFAAASIARVRCKSEVIPLVAVLHEYQWFDLAKSVSVAGSSIAQAPQFTDSIMANWYRGRTGGIDIFVTSNSSMLSGTDAYGAVFARDAMALDWRRPIRIEPDRDPSRRGTEFNMSAVYAKGVWRPLHGVQIISDATTPV